MTIRDSSGNELTAAEVAALFGLLYGEAKKISRCVPVDTGAEAQEFAAALSAGLLALWEAGYQAGRAAVERETVVDRSYINRASQAAAITVDGRAIESRDR